MFTADGRRPLRSWRSEGYGQDEVAVCYTPLRVVGTEPAQARRGRTGVIVRKGPSFDAPPAPMNDGGLAYAPVDTHFARQSLRRAPGPGCPAPAPRPAVNGFVWGYPADDVRTNKSGWVPLEVDGVRYLEADPGYGTRPGDPGGLGLRPELEGLRLPLGGVQALLRLRLRRLRPGRAALHGQAAQGAPHGLRRAARQWRGVLPALGGELDRVRLSGPGRRRLRTRPQARPLLRAAHGAVELRRGAVWALAARRDARVLPAGRVPAGEQAAAARRTCARRRQPRRYTSASSPHSSVAAPR